MAKPKSGDKSEPEKKDDKLPRLPPWETNAKPTADPPLGRGPYKPV